MLKASEGLRLSLEASNSEITQLRKKATETSDYEVELLLKASEASMKAKSSQGIEGVEHSSHHHHHHQQHHKLQIMEAELDACKKELQFQQELAEHAKREVSKLRKSRARLHSEVDTYEVKLADSVAEADGLRELLTSAWRSVEQAEVALGGQPREANPNPNPNPNPNWRWLLVGSRERIAMDRVISMGRSNPNPNPNPKL